MSRAGLVLALPALIGLAACSSQKEPASEPSQGSHPAPAREEPDVSGEPTAPATDLVDTSSIPPLLRGRWGLVPLDCTGDPAAAKGLVTVRPDKLEFYESVAELGSIKEIGEGAISAEFRFEGEGQTWDLDVELVSPDGGKTMVRTDHGEDAAPQPLTYTKCP